MKIRNPKSERIPKLESRIAILLEMPRFKSDRASGFGLLSDFGLRISDFHFGIWDLDFGI